LADTDNGETGRRMRMVKRFGACTMVALVAASVSLAANADDMAAARFEKFKSMAGDWTASGGDGSVAANYKVTAAGSAVVETLFPGTPHEMVTVYTIDKGDLVLTHYCGAGNQPHMKAIPSGDAQTVSFEFDGGGNIKSPGDGHMHEAKYAFTDADHVKATWVYYQGGKPGKNEEFSLVRKKS
jgi:hypothetical protein